MKRGYDARKRRKLTTCRFRNVSETRNGETRIETPEKRFTLFRNVLLVYSFKIRLRNVILQILRRFRVGSDVFPSYSFKCVVSDYLMILLIYGIGFLGIQFYVFGYSHFNHFENLSFNGWVLEEREKLLDECFLFQGR